MTGLRETRRLRIREAIEQHRSFKFCGPSDDLEEITAVTMGYRHLVVQIQRLAGPILPEPAASLLRSLGVEIDDLYSAINAHSEIEALILDIEEALASCTSSNDHFHAAGSTESLKQLLMERDFSTINQEFTRCLDYIETDPPAAITAACSILESMCKVYIEDNALAVPTNQSVAPLWKVVSKDLGFDPSAVEDSDVRKILSGLTSIVNGIGSLRTHAGSAHGRGKVPYKVHKRHARLAIHASHTLVAFVIQTSEHRSRANR